MLFVGDWLSCVVFCCLSLWCVVVCCLLFVEVLLLFVVRGVSLGDVCWLL